MRAIFGKVAGLVFVALLATDAQAQPNGGALYARACAQCHDSSDTDIRAPRRDVLRAMTPEAILRALQMGSMKPFAWQLSTAEQEALATWVAGRGFAQQAASVAADPDGRCTAGDGGASFASIDGPSWNGWGAGPANTRFQGTAAAGLSADTVGKLHLKWAFGLAGALSANGQPTIVGGRVFVGGGDRKLHALDAKTGCTHWSFTTDAAVRTAPSVGPRRDGAGFAVYFGDLAAYAYALDAASGALLWKVKVDPHRAARITGAPALHDGVLYVPVSSIEEAFAARADYECCTFRGSVVALDAETGAELWKSYTVPDPPLPTKRNSVGVQQFGPAGAAVWSAPTVDAAKGALYVATGNAYAQPAADGSDAVIALELGTGRRLWQRQLTAGDAFVVGCSRLVPNCPDDPGPDHDFGQSPILKTLGDGRRVLVIGQKSGVVHALDPDRQGEILWQVRVGKGGTLGGSQWGSAADDANVYVAISDVRFLPSRQLDPNAGGGLHAIDLSTGAVKWSVPPVPCGERPLCSPALSAAVTALPGVVLSGGVSGWLRAYATADGRLLWEVDTARDDYATVNGVPGRGGAMDGPGPTVAGGMVYVTSGYAQWGGKSGNVVLAFGLGD
ncbi:MAG: PQQ-binding-like beta-propeller repeat protein [Alphaproteobacteria bacterium]|nr:PQQ-binding-like beta-propeller repeat protein [Alphaproteobacteria bacterium]